MHDNMNFESLQKELQKLKINTVLVNQNGQSIYEYYKNKKQKEKLHKLNSCTKSVMSILMGIALDKGFLETIYLPVSHFFPKIFENLADKRKYEMTIDHLLTMSDGLHFPEFGEWNYFAPMVYHHDIVKFVIDRPLENPVGTHMNYNSGCSHILSAILQQVTKRTTEEFAYEHLFKPLGIEDYSWYMDNMKINKGADGLVLKADDMMKIGQLMLNKGVYNKKKIVSEDWITQSTLPHMLTYENIGYYGKHWWVNKIDEQKDFSIKNTFYFALGFGGQYIIILPSKEMVISITSDIYTDSLKPMRVLREHLFSQFHEN
jgi:CubicO group peptidase (beta-lactamase class C family)